MYDALAEQITLAGGRTRYSLGAAYIPAVYIYTILLHAFFYERFRLNMTITLKAHQDTAAVYRRVYI